MRGGDATRETFILGDPLRGLAAIGVLATHAFFACVVLGAFAPLKPSEVDATLKDQFGVIGHLTVFGENGLWIFLALSGYLISRPFVGSYLHGKPMPRLGRYVRGRLLRILPAFWIAAGLTLLVFGTLGTSADRILAAFGLAGIYYPSIFFFYIGQSWTLTTEMSFYLLLPAILLVLALALRRVRGMRVRAAVLLGVLAAVTVATVAVATTAPASLAGRVGITNLGYAFVSGVALAVLEHFLPERVRRLRNGARLGAALAVGGVVACFVLVQIWPSGVLVRPLASLCAGFVLAGCLVRQWADGGSWRLVDNRLFRYLGERSYSIYLLHYVVIRYMQEKVAPPEDAWGRATWFVPVAFVASIAVGEVVYRVAERPYLRRRAKLAGGRRAAPTPDPAGGRLGVLEA